jgi:hypothetical protein
MCFNPPYSYFYTEKVANLALQLRGILLAVRYIETVELGEMGQAAII